MTRRLTAEALGTAFLLATVVGSGIMAERLAGGNTAIALLGNTLPTGAILVVLITVFGPISGATFNPAVPLVFRLRGELTNAEAFQYTVVQVVGGVVGVVGVIIANLIFELPAVSWSTTARAGSGQWLGEFVATFGLIATILGCVHRAPERVAVAVGLYITAAYWSTSFANPAVTVARAFSDTFAGIAPGGVAGFVLVQGAAAVMALGAMNALLGAVDSADPRG